MGKRQWSYQWQMVRGLGEVLTRGRHDGLPVLSWGWADREKLATVRQLRDRGLRPGGADPVACLLFQYAKPGRRSTDFAVLYLVSEAVPKRVATAAQRVAIARALRARRTCRECGTERAGIYLSTISRLCSGCETATDFWAAYAREHGHTWEAAA